ncbi:MAG: cell division protein FtsQ [Desulfovibrionales bacterium]|nr:cell division protein FtsQ [Desulfovibrionales bacterium]
MGYSYAVDRQARRSRLGLANKKANKAAKPKRSKGASLKLWLAGLRRMALAALLLSVLAGLCLACLAGYRWMTSLPYFAIKDIRIEGAQRLTYGEILSESGLELGQNSLAVNLGKVEAALSRDPWIKKLAVQRVLPDAIVLKIKEREPSFWVRVKDKLFYANNRGEAIAEVEPQRFASLPFLDASEDVQDAGATLERLLGAMQRRDLPFGLAQASWVGLSGRTGLELQLAAPDMTVQLGQKDLAGNMRRLELVWEDLSRRGELHRIKSLTVRQGKAWAEFRDVR